MSEKKITIRLETKDDYRAVENLTCESFWNVYRPGCMEHYVLHRYRDDPAFVPELDFVMELDGELIGQVIYVRSEIDCDDGRKRNNSVTGTVYALLRHPYAGGICRSSVLDPKSQALESRFSLALHGRHGSESGRQGGRPL